MNISKPSYFPKAVVFDLDGTLVDSKAQVAAAFQYALEPFGIKFTREVLEVIRSRTHSTLFAKILGPEEARSAQQRLGEFSPGPDAQMVLYEGLLPILQLLYDKKIPTAIWTGRDSASTLKFLAASGLEHFFSRVVGGCQVAENKPHPEGLTRLVQHFGCEPHEVLMIGDRGAQLAGCHSALVLWSDHAADPRDHAPSMVFASTQALYDYFKCS
jgi:phosphoglycolate phosphatase